MQEIKESQGAEGPDIERAKKVIQELIHWGGSEKYGFLLPLTRRAEMAGRMAAELGRLRDVVGPVDGESIEDILLEWRALEAKK